jgi:lincosamide nucleotidyltransferase A/C/D/E
LYRGDDGPPEPAPGAAGSVGLVEAEQVTALYADLERHGVPVWLMGGWGVDALLRRQTREHHDLDVLVEAAALERLRARLEELGFELRYLWDDEVQWIRDPSWHGADAQPTAFVYGQPTGLEVDVHVIRRDADGTVATLWTVPYAITAEGLEGRGTVAGRPVRCLTAELQRVAHTGYELPTHHVADLRLLDG